MLRPKSTVEACLADARAQASLLNPSRPYTPATSMDRDSGFGDFGGDYLRKRRSSSSSNRPRGSSKTKKSSKARSKVKVKAAEKMHAAARRRKASDASDDSLLRGWSSEADEFDGGIISRARSSDSFTLDTLLDDPDNDDEGDNDPIDTAASPYALRVLAMDQAHKTLDRFSGKENNTGMLVGLCDEQLHVRGWQQHGAPGC